MPQHMKGSKRMFSITNLLEWLVKNTEISSQVSQLWNYQEDTNQAGWRIIRLAALILYAADVGGTPGGTAVIGGD